jgi:hypothetical protein
MVLMPTLDSSESDFIVSLTPLNGGSMHATNDALQLKRVVFTPNIYSLDEQYQTLKQVEGIKNLIDFNKSIPYTSKNYGEVIEKLNMSLPKDTLW